MKKEFYAILLLMLATLPLMAQPPLGRWNTRAVVVDTDKPIYEAAASESFVVLEEDFSLFTAGSETAPDSKDITDNNFFVDSKYTHIPNWIGHNVHQAGGKCALLKYNINGYSGYGHISTPEMEMYGDVVVSFKARRAHSNPNAGRLRLSLCNNTYGIIEEVYMDVTNEWAEYKWEVKVEDFSPYCIFQFTPHDGELLLDDIKVERTRSIIPGVDVLNPINNSTSEFVARWSKSPLDGIEGYLLNVYYKDFPPEDVEPGSYFVDFESINVLADGTSIDTANPGYPEGWDIKVSSKGTTDMRTDEGFYNSGSQAIYFDAAGDSIISPVSPAPISKVSFWVRPTTMEQESFNFSLIGVNVVHKDGMIERIANIPNYWMEENGGYYVLEGDVIGEYIYQVQIFCESSYNVKFAIDDIQIDYEVQPVPYEYITDKFVADTFYLVSGVDADKEYYYNVRVKEGDILSSQSSDMWVDGLIGVVPTIYPASDVTETSFTASWEPIFTASNYKLNVEQTLYTLEDNEEVTIVYEDFSALTEGSIVYPHDEWVSVYNLNDNGRTELDWMLTAPQWVKGMAGSRGSSSSGLAGLVLGPQMNLNEYDIKVDFTARNSQRNDTLWVMLMEEYYSTSAELGVQYGFPDGKVSTATGTVYFEGRDWGDKPLRIAFMSQNGVKFYIDEVRVSYLVPRKGSKISRPYKSIVTPESYCTFSDIPANAPTYSYYVTAKRTKNFVEYMSEPSETIVVTLPTSLNDAIDDNNRIFVNGDVLNVQVADATGVELYNLQGMVIATYEALPGNNTFRLQQGVYLVKVGGDVYKVLAR